MSETIDLVDGAYRRIYVDGFLYGSRINGVSPMAEWLFLRLFCVMDLNCVFPADTRRLLLQAFPARQGQLSEGQILDWLNELASVGLVRRYQVGDRIFGVFIDAPDQPGGRNGKRPKSIFPQPPSDESDGSWIDPPGCDSRFKETGKPVSLGGCLDAQDAPGCAGLTKSGSCASKPKNDLDAQDCKNGDPAHSISINKSINKKENDDDDTGAPVRGPSTQGNPRPRSSSSFFDSSSGKREERERTPPPPSPTTPPTVPPAAESNQTPPSLPPPRDSQTRANTTPPPSCPQPNAPNLNLVGADDDVREMKSRLDRVLNELTVKFGVTKRDCCVFRNLVERGEDGWTVERIEQAVETVTLQAKFTKVKNPRAYVVKAINEGWMPPPPSEIAGYERLHQEDERLRESMAAYRRMIDDRRRRFIDELSDEVAFRLRDEVLEKHPEHAMWGSTDLRQEDPRKNCVLGTIMFEIVNEDWLAEIHERMVGVEINRDNEVSTVPLRQCGGAS